MIYRSFASFMSMVMSFAALACLAVFGIAWLGLRRPILVVSSLVCLAVTRLVLLYLEIW